MITSSLIITLGAATTAAAAKEQRLLQLLPEFIIVIVYDLSCVYSLREALADRRSRQTRQSLTIKT